MKLHAKACFARLWIMLLFTVLSMVSVSAVSFAVSIGQRCQGGIVFYVDGSGQHGLVAATRDLPGQYDWQGAKEACERFVDGGFSDWYLPDKRDLNQLYLHQNAFRGFAEDCYWSSTEERSGRACYQAFGGLFEGQYLGGSTDIRCRVRPVREF